MSRNKRKNDEPLCLTYTVALPRTAHTEAGEAVDLPERLRWMGRALLPWMNASLAALHTEAILDRALTWKHWAWPHLRPLMSVQKGIPSRVARGAQEVVGRVLVSHATRRQAFSVLREAWDAGLEQLLEQDKVYPAVLRALEAWKARHGQDAPAAGYLLGVAEQLAADHRRRTETRWSGSTWAEWAAFCGQPAPAAWAAAYTELQRPPRLRRLLLTYAADDGPEQGQACQYRLTPDGTALDVRLRVPTRPAPTKTGDWAWCRFRLRLPEVVQGALRRGGRLRAPDLRQRDDGTWVLDIKVEPAPREAGPRSLGRILAFDWGHRKLVTAVVLEETPSGWVQLTRPFFLNPGGVYAKLRELRIHASRLRRQADRLRNERRREPDPARRRELRRQQELAQRELAAVWRRFRELQKQMAHLASGLPGRSGGGLRLLRPRGRMARRPEEPGPKSGSQLADQQPSTCQDPGAPPLQGSPGGHPGGHPGVAAGDEPPVSAVRCGRAADRGPPAVSPREGAAAEARDPRVAPGAPGDQAPAAAGLVVRVPAVRGQRRP